MITLFGAYPAYDGKLRSDPVVHSLWLADYLFQQVCTKEFVDMSRDPQVMRKWNLCRHCCLVLSILL